MADHSLVSRRRVVAIVGSGTVVALAGCSSGGRDSAGDETTEPENTSAEADQTTENQTTATQETETTTATESRFATEGDDSVPIEKALEELVLNMSELPGDGWESKEPPVFAGAERQSNRAFARGDNETEVLHCSAVLAENVEDAQEFYNYINIRRITGGIEADETIQLDIAVDSQWSFAEYDHPSDESKTIKFHLLKFRDANGFGMIRWNRIDSNITRDEIGPLGVTMHEKWR
ncbi:hypothetical protein [Halostella litorea]|uniref:hypothetical protein n=1 Tax=Halostella litorea TaxID=2528831 RepID=UPI0010926674|nr:hypothetical protein [Halostella litorea]